MKKANRMPGGKAASRKMLGKKKSLAHDNPPGFDMMMGKAAGKKESMPASRKASANVAKKPRSLGSPKKAAKPVKIKTKKPG